MKVEKMIASQSGIKVCITNGRDYRAMALAISRETKNK